MKLIGIIVVLFALRWLLSSPTVISYDPLLYIVGAAAIGFLVLYEFPFIKCLRNLKRLIFFQVLNFIKCVYPPKSSSAPLPERATL
jgi:hypothetical protein